MRANRADLTQAEVVAAVYRDAAALGEELSNEHKLLIEQMVEAYSKLDEAVIHDIKERQHMRFVANSITEHYEHIGELRGEQRGKKLGELWNIVEGGLEQLRQYEALLAEGILSKRAYSRLARPLKAKVAAAEAALQTLNRDLNQHAQPA